MSMWTVYLPPRHHCPQCRAEIQPRERVFMCEAGELCVACGKVEEDLLKKHVCDWCGRPADDRALLKGAGSSVWWCRNHARVGRESAANFQPASKGSLYGEIHRGKLGDAEEARL